ncbi:sugar transferase [Sinisalibacter aestuarii]|uniref:Sugar transferase n=1 Tax=Sinisalibacter aestuarii TaxID=2949426 RepID=A0ABQ5LV24_9RHOB|nr:sugar transferase [Sinisalibacter aestuarii]GKY88819.1 sugar transferase [Sinisalibacter aestuarii]
MTFSKRAFDLTLALTLGILLLPVIGGIAAVILVRDGRPVFFGHKRARAPGQNFTLWKFRTMINMRRKSDHGVSGGHKRRRITPTGRFLRKTRLDELPQLWNVIRGDISFVGPRPPDPRYVKMFPELYGEVLKSRPGITGLATLIYHKTEERLLAQCRTPQQTEEVYTRRCVPRKARLDLIYAENRTLCYDIFLMLHTVFRKLPLHLKAWR